ncbi:MAG: hypothetical protein MUQ27_11905 [Acidimicrobiia bacterium]|nr:hypothetical protein [Acidimicrobiia bacterium]
MTSSSFPSAWIRGWWLGEWWGLMVGLGFEMSPMVTIRVKVRAGRSDTLPRGVGEMAGRPETALEVAAGRW